MSSNEVCHGVTQLGLKASDGSDVLHIQDGSPTWLAVDPGCWPGGSAKVHSDQLYMAFPCGWDFFYHGGRVLGGVSAPEIAEAVRLLMI